MSEWTTRVILTLIVALAGYSAVTRSLAEVVGNTDPVQAHALAPGNGRVTARLARQELLDHPDADRDRQSRITMVAQQALRQDATAVAAVETLGFVAQIRGDTTKARRLFDYAQRLTRRELAVQIWAVEYAVTRGDIRGALSHYDIALRTSKSAPDVLFPVLAAAISEAPIRAGLVETLARQPAWSPKFISYVAQAQADSHARADLFVGLHKLGVPVPAEADAATIGGLVTAGDMAGAWRFYAAIRPGVDVRRSRDPHFAASLSTPSPFDWAASVDTNLTASFQGGVKGGVFDYAAPSGMGGLLLQQLQMLPPGSYRLNGHGSGVDQPDEALPYWSLTCRDGRELGRVAMPRSDAGGGRFGGALTVPADCPVQTLALFARPSDRVSGVEGQIDEVRLTPVEPQS